MVDVRGGGTHSLAARGWGSAPTYPPACCTHHSPHKYTPTHSPCFTVTALRPLLPPPAPLWLTSPLDTSPAPPLPRESCESLHGVHRGGVEV